VSRLLGAALIAAAACSQPAPESRKESIVVTGTWEPVPAEEADRSVRSIPVEKARLLANTFVDFLRLDPSLDLRQRAPNGVQADLSIRGGTFGQTLVLLDGMRLNDPQSGHHSLDLPVPLEAISRIEVLRGSGSANYGSDAVAGVVNIVTERAEAPELRLRGGIGNFGVNQQRASLAFGSGRWYQTLLFSRDFSTGFRPNRDYRNLILSSISRARSRLGWSNVTLGYADKPFGADQFYGNFPSWENTKTWFAGGRQELGSKTEATFAFRRHSDLFVLYRDRPQVYHNHHATRSWQGILRRREQLASNVRLYYGGEGFADDIVSTNLGNHSRRRGAAYGTLDVRALQRFSFTVGAREEIYGRLQSQFSPTASAAYWLGEGWKIRASASRAFRVPTYTELFYSDPANLGNPALRPETGWTYEGGLDWFGGGDRRWRAEAILFHRRERDGIDYVRPSPLARWQAVNIQRLRFTGVETSLGFRAGRSQDLDFRYTAMRGVAAELEGLQSKYVFQYPVHSGVFQWQGTLPASFVGRARVGGLQRRRQDAIALVDLYLVRTGRRVQPFLQATNVTNTSYEEIPGVAMQGRAIVGGVEIIVRLRR
jgi:iron complex outermembrane receptor protein